MDNFNILTIEQIEFLYGLLNRFNKLDKSSRKLLLINLKKKIDEKREEQKNE